MQNIIAKINAIYPITAIELQLLLKAMERIEFSKNHIIISSDKVERYLYVIEKGIARAYSNTDKQQTTFWFGEETDFILSYNSYVNQQPGYENIELLEDSALYRIANSTLQELYLHHLGLSNWGRKLAELELIKTEERLINRQFKTAAERYHELINNSPSLIKRVQLGYIASYLGITQVTLSRIRAELK
ncbi:MAG: Crp/Fnr family transcriptional regulator [Bacteroidota bacterium]